MSTEIRPNVARDTPVMPLAGLSKRPPVQRSWLNVVLLLALILVAVGGITLIPKLVPQQDKRYLTHQVARGELSVAVTEQGTLESSNNTEIVCKVRGWSTVTWVVKGGTIVQPGDELVRLDTKLIEEQLSLTKTNTFVAKSTLERTKADLEKAEIAIDAYLSGRYRSQLQAAEQAREIARSNLETSRNMLSQSKQLYRRGYVNKLDVQGNEFTVTQAELELEVTDAEINALKEFTQKMEMETLSGNLRAARAKLESDLASLKMEQSRQKRAEQELRDCVLKADRAGLVIYPSSAAWKNAPDIAQGARVRKDQVLLLMPDLNKMQVKVGIHESVVDRIHPGLPARVAMPELTLDASVTRVAAATRPAGWWTGNIVKYDTIIELPEGQGLKPGMSAEVQVVMAHHPDVLLVPVAAVIEAEKGDLCWVMTRTGPERRVVELGDTNDITVAVKAGLREGEEVILNPVAYVKEAETESLATIGKRAEPTELTSTAETSSIEPDFNLSDK